MSVIMVLDNEFGGRRRSRSKSIEIPDRYIGEVRQREERNKENDFDIRGVMDFINEKE